jgi:colanic acid biosynthesis glycosyl transferase WcaI
VMYSGTISISSNRALERILEAARSLNGDKDIQFVVVGEGLKKEGLEQRARGIGLNNVVFLPFQPYDDLPMLLASADILLVPLDRDKSAISVPSKLYNFMAAGRPILGLTTNDSEVAAVIRGTGSGLSVLPDDSEAMGAAILGLKADGDRRKTFGANARAYVAEHFAITTILETYERVMTEMRP